MKKSLLMTTLLAALALTACEQAPQTPAASTAPSTTVTASEPAPTSTPAASEATAAASSSASEPAAASEAASAGEEKVTGKLVAECEAYFKHEEACFSREGVDDSYKNSIAENKKQVLELTDKEQAEQCKDWEKELEETLKEEGDKC